jgi:hypothetical protein
VKDKSPEDAKKAKEEIKALGGTPSDEKKKPAKKKKKKKKKKTS